MATETISLPKILPRDATKKLIAPKIRVEKASGLYLGESNLPKIPMTPLHWESLIGQPKVQAVLARLQLEEITNRLKKRQQEYANASKYISKQYDKLNKIEKRVVKMRNKIVGMRKILKRRTEGAEDLTKDILRTMAIKRRMIEKVEEYKFYEEFLLKVVEAGRPEFKTPIDVIRRYCDLGATKFEIAQDQQDVLKKFDASCDELSKMLQQRRVKLNELRNVRDNLLARYKDAKYRSLKSEALIASVKFEAKEAKFETVTVKDACWTLYLHIKAKKFTDVELEKEDVKGQLRVIDGALGLLGKIALQLNISK